MEVRSRYLFRVLEMNEIIGFRRNIPGNILTNQVGPFPWILRRNTQNQTPGYLWFSDAFGGILEVHEISQC